MHGKLKHQFLSKEINKNAVDVNWKLNRLNSELTTKIQVKGRLKNSQE